ncbi:hypothetical protein AWB78_08483 [Caballeronia calidae]|uniref:Uncharacterized protein n=1 Tax=Caballeronia calidae TaxID=1777139 RepID=A0A158ELI7_9BURK|nr:hypothetical protein AWB78_08483 [Caballeronia calidae]
MATRPGKLHVASFVMRGRAPVRFAASPSSGTPGRTAPRAARLDTCPAVRSASRRLQVDGRKTAALKALYQCRSAARGCRGTMLASQARDPTGDAILCSSSPGSSRAGRMTDSGSGSTDDTGDPRLWLRSTPAICDARLIVVLVLVAATAFFACNTSDDLAESATDQRDNAGGNLGKRVFLGAVLVALTSTATAGQHYVEVWNPPEARSNMPGVSSQSHKSLARRHARMKASPGSNVKHGVRAAATSWYARAAGRPHARPTFNDIPRQITPEGNILRVSDSSGSVALQR